MKVGFKTIGCRLNQYDTELIREEFESAGFETVDENADIYVVNTCAVTGKANREARNIARTLAKKTFVIVTGCGVQSDYERLSSINGVQIVEPEPRKIVENFLKVPLIQGISNFRGHNKAFVKIQEGCNQFCSYCIVPYVKGKPRQREKEEIIAEINRLANNGYKEIILTGTNISKYEKLLDLLEQIARIENIKNFGLSSIEPSGISDELLDFIQSCHKINRYFHIPLQSGDNKILKSMNRWYSPEEYAELIYKIKKRMPDSAIGADVIVGFPGEGEQEFENTYNFVSIIPISRLHIFRYSKRPFISALKLNNEPSEKVKKQRSKLLAELGEKKWEAFRKQFIGKQMEVHIEEKEIDGWKVGVTTNYIKVLFKSQINSGFIPLQIKQIDGEKSYGVTLSTM